MVLYIHSPGGRTVTRSIPDSIALDTECSCGGLCPRVLRTADDFQLLEFLHPEQFDNAPDKAPAHPDDEHERVIDLREEPSRRLGGQFVEHWNV